MKYLILRICKKGITTIEIVDQDIKADEFDYIDSLIFLTRGWDDLKFGVFNLTLNKIHFCTKKLREKTLLNQAKPFLRKKEDDDIWDNLPKPELQSINLEKFGYFTDPFTCSHQFAVYSDPKKKKDKKRPLTAILCGKKASPYQCQSITCQRGRYFCPDHITRIKLYVHETVPFHVCYDCLFGFHLQALLKYISGHPVSVYNGIIVPDLDPETLPLLIRGLSDRIFEDTYAMCKNKREVQRTQLTTYEKQYVATLRKLNCAQFQECKEKGLFRNKPVLEDDIPISLLKTM